MKRGLFVIALLAFVACKGKDTDKLGTGSGSIVHARAKIDGPSVTPVVTSSITFVVPKEAAWWGELAFACYSAAINLQPGNSPGAALRQVSPNLGPAAQVADIDLDHDLQAFGMFACGEGPCLYTAVTLRHPEKLPDMLARLIPSSQPKTLSKNHYTVEAPGAQGPRTIHIQAFPIAWPDKLPSDAWARDAATATHVIFISGIFGKAVDDPLAALADPQTGATRVHEAESLLADAHGMCVRGLVGKREFQPGYELDHARFAFAAPEGKGDPLTKMLGSLRTLDLEFEFTLTPAPTDAVVNKWIDQARTWVSMTAAPVRAQFAAQGPLVDVMFDLAGLLGERGFRHSLKGNALSFSWRTDRVSSTDLMAYEVRLAKAMKDAGLDPNAVAP
jgi:hypothetical protein